MGHVTILDRSFTRAQACRSGRVPSLKSHRFRFWGLGNRTLQPTSSWRSLPPNIPPRFSLTASSLDAPPWTAYPSCHRLLSSSRVCVSFRCPPWLPYGQGSACVRPSRATEPLRSDAACSGSRDSEEVDRCGQVMRCHEVITVIRRLRATKESVLCWAIALIRRCYYRSQPRFVAATRVRGRAHARRGAVSELVKRGDAMS